jgi:TatD DNase family protein
LFSIVSSSFFLCGCARSCPYCDVLSSHAGHKFLQTKFVAKAEQKFEKGFTVKRRQEPCHIVHVAEVIAGCRGDSVENVVQSCYENTLAVFRLGDKGGGGDTPT